MKSEKNSGTEPDRAAVPLARNRLAAPELYALIFGLFLGLALVKFGNPVILDDHIAAPASWTEARTEAWPPHWASGILAVLALIGAGLVLTQKPRWPASRWLWLLPLAWLGWQLISATHTVDSALTLLTLCQFGGCVACYFLGVHVLGHGRGVRLLMVGVLAAFAFCLVRAVDQRIVEFPRERQLLLEGERTSWTNFPPEMIQQLRHTGVILTTNGVDIANPVFLAKYEKGRVHGTLIYPNALAGVVLLLLPVALVLVLQVTRPFRLPTRVLAVGLIGFLGAAGLIWSGSKSGWLIALALGLLTVWRTGWPRKLKWGLLIAIVALGLTAFGLRFHNYFAKGATSVGARFDYWRVAARIAAGHPVLGSGPGTFQRLYGPMKAPEAEMARLAHNDYLEQFSDSGFPGGISYMCWIALLLWTIGRRSWKSGGWLEFAIFAGLLGWFGQGLIEFSLYVPALAWTAFTLGGCLLAGNQFDKFPPRR